MLLLGWTISGAFGQENQSEQDNQEQENSESQNSKENGEEIEELDFDWGSFEASGDSETVDNQNESESENGEAENDEVEQLGQSTASVFEDDEPIEFSGNFSLSLDGSHIFETPFNPGNVAEISEIAIGSVLQLKFQANIAETTALVIEPEFSYTPLGNVDEFNKEKEELSLFLNTAYIDFQFSDYLLFRVGKQRIGWGTGNTWNPADSLNPPKNVMDPEATKRGTSAIMLDVPFGDVSLTFAFVPDIPDVNYTNFSVDLPQIEETRLGFQLYFLTFDTDVFLNISWKYNDTLVPGIALARELFWGLVFHFEGGFLINNQRRYYKDISATDNPSWELRDDELFFNFVFGFNKMISANGFWVMEYFFNHSGYDDAEMQNFIENAEQSGTSDTMLETYFPIVSEDNRTGYLRQHYLFLSLNYTIEDTVGLALRSVWNIDGNTFFVIPEIMYVRKRNLDITLSGIIAPKTDEKGDFYHLPFYYGVGLNIKVYF